jgi:hypothetical protein
MSQEDEHRTLVAFGANIERPTPNERIELRRRKGRKEKSKGLFFTSRSRFRQLKNKRLLGALGV